MLAATHLSSFASPVSLTLDGNTDYDGWQVLYNTGSNFPGSGSMFPGLFPWGTSGGSWTSYQNGGTTYGAIGSDAAGSGDALLYKIANGGAGGPYPSGMSIYFGGMSAKVNYDGGTLGVVDPTPLSGLKTVAFQIEIGTAWGYDFYNDVLPTFTYTTSTGTHSLEASYSGLVTQVFSGQILMPTGYEDIYKNTWGLQFDLSNISETILSYQVSFTGVQHSQLYSLRLDQSSESYTENLLFQHTLWNGEGADTAWSTKENWEDGAPPAPDATLVFKEGNRADLDADYSARKIFLSSDEGFTLGSVNGAVLTVGEQGIVADSATPASHEITAKTNMSHFQIVTVEAGNDLTFSGGLTTPGFYKKGEGNLHLRGENVFTGNGFGTVFVVGGENSIGGKNTYTGPGTIELNVKESTVTLVGGENPLSSNFTVNLVSTATFNSNGTVRTGGATGHLVLGDDSGKSDQTFAGIKSDQTTAFRENAFAPTKLAASEATITGGNAAISTLGSDVAAGGIYQY